jgi:hypothetical protein
MVVSDPIVLRHILKENVSPHILDILLLLVHIKHILDILLLR